MPREQSVESLLRRTLGKDAAEALLDKIDRLVARRATKEAIEKAITADLKRHFVEQVTAAIGSSVGPLSREQAAAVQKQVRPIINGIIVRLPAINKVVIVISRPGRGVKTRK